MMLDSPHTSAPMLMRGNTPPTTHSPPHRSRLTGYPPNRQPATVSEEERGGRGTTSRRTSTRAARENVFHFPPLDADLRSAEGLISNKQLRTELDRRPNMRASDENDCVPNPTFPEVVVSSPFSLFLLHNHIINKKQSFSGCKLRSKF